MTWSIRIKHRAIASLLGRFHGNGRAKEWACFFSGANRPVAHTAHTQDMSTRKIGQRTKPEHMAALNTVSKAICIRCVNLSDHKNEFCNFLYSKTLYQMHTLFFSRPTVQDGERTVQFNQWVINSGWTLSRSPLEVVSYQRNLNTVFLIKARVLSKSRNASKFKNSCLAGEETEQY